MRNSPYVMYFTASTVTQNSERSYESPVHIHCLDKARLRLRPPGMIVSTSGSDTWNLEIHDHIK